MSFSWGRGRHGVLGDGTAEEGEAPPSSPRIVAGPLNGRRISQLCCGELHTLALTAEAGAVFSWGSGLMGALGHGGRSNELAPRRVEAVPFATQLAAGKHHSAALCPDGGGAVLAGPCAWRQPPPRAWCRIRPRPWSLQRLRHRRHRVQNRPRLRPTLGTPHPRKSSRRSPWTCGAG
jgi:hypothetical protein